MKSVFSQFSVVSMSAVTLPFLCSPSALPVFVLNYLFPRVGLRRLLGYFLVWLRHVRPLISAVTSVDR